MRWGLGIWDSGTGCECGKPGCRECAEAAALAKLVREEFEQTQHQARVPTPEIVWWRAQMRAREEAARAAARPILLSQALAIAALIGLLVSVAGRLTLPAIFVERIGAGCRHGVAGPDDRDRGRMLPVDRAASPSTSRFPAINKSSREFEQEARITREE